ncbi:Small subunit (SSU) processome component [Bachmanniomyces sp. S44760]|nr:Small subunit (SSU) processome component [Bachmanniomyces sp. S44760]
MVRKLKHHEQKLLRKVDFTTYKSDNNHRDAAVMRRYAVSRPDDYTKYNRLCGSIRQLAHNLTLLPASSPFRQKQEKLLLAKLYDVGILSTAGGNSSLTPSETLGKLSEVEKKVTVSAMCRRRLGIVMTRLRMAETVQAANKFIEQGHVRVGTEVVNDPAFLVNRNMEDFVTWVDESKVKRAVLGYRNELDDFDLL